ncbi:MAG: peptidoglycan recognition family protein [bacterium]|jgi:hypothetical protein
MEKPARVLLALACCCVLLAGCAAPPKGPAAANPGAPAWLGAPPGWGRLEWIESWLAGAAAGFSDYWQVQGHLALAEGRLAYAGNDATALQRRARSRSARIGFQTVLEHPGASDDQLLQARHGLKALALFSPPADSQTGGEVTASNASYLPRSSWRASRPAPSRLTRNSGPYTRITVHHTADVPGALFNGSFSDSTSTVRRVQGEHMDGRGYGDIGYHFMIDAAGRCFAGRDLVYQGAHAGGVRNRQNIGVCLLGNFEHGRPSPRALAALDKILAELRGRHRIPRKGVVCHRELKSTVCPGAHLAAWTRRYRRAGPKLANLTGGQVRLQTASGSARGNAGRALSLDPTSVR